MIRNEKGQFVKGKNIVNLKGKKFGKLTVIGIDVERTKSKTYWMCQCECGNKKSVRSDCLQNGNVKSCGCLKKEQDIYNLGIKNNHNCTHHPLFGIHNSMMHRCENEKNNQFYNYGGRGISVCKEWHDVRNFIKWAEDNNYEEGLTIERIDVNDDYKPSNCKFIPFREQAFNKRNTLYTTYKGEIVQFARFVYEHNLDYHKIYERHIKNKIPLEQLV